MKNWYYFRNSRRLVDLNSFDLFWIENKFRLFGRSLESCNSFFIEEFQDEEEMNTMLDELYKCLIIREDE